MDEGLPQVTVQAIAQGPDGYMWIGTQDGLARFDGHSFKRFDKSNTPAFNVNDIKELVFTRDGTLWIATNGGGVLAMRNQEFRAYTTEQGLVNNSVFCLLESKEHGLFVGTTDGLSVFQNGIFTNYGTKDGLSFGLINDIKEDEKGRIWIATGKGLNRFENGKIYSRDELGDYPTGEMDSIHIDSRGALWTGTQNSGVYKRQGEAFKRYDKNEGLGISYVSDILEDRNGNLWISLYGGGLCRYRDDRFHCYTKQDGLVDDDAICLFEDREGSLWVGTHIGGLTQFRNAKFTSYSTLDGLSEKNARTIYEDSSGNLWIGLNVDGLSRFRDGQIETFGEDQGLPHKAGVRGLFEDSKKRLWIGTYSGGVYHFENNRFVKPEIVKELPSGSVRAFAEDKEGAIWFGVYGKGVFRYREGEDGPSLEQFTEEKDGIASDLILFINKDSQDAIWIGTWGNGLTRYKNGQFEVFTKEKDGLGHDVILAFYEDAEGNLWFGTYGGGLMLFKDGKFHNFTVKQGLLDDGLMSVLSDGQGNLWMGCSKGIFKIPRSELQELAAGKRTRVESTAYGKADGMKSHDCNGGSQPSAAMTRDGRLWFPTVDGITSINPKEIRINTTPPPIVLEEVLVDATSAELRRRMRVEPGAEKFEFHYTSPSFISNEKILFQYKLEGFDRDWVDAQNRRVAYYTNLNPGEYHFSLKARNADGVWSSPKTVVSLQLVPAFWQTLWFRIALVLLFVLLLQGIARLRIKRIKRANLILEQKVLKRTAQLKEAHAKIVRFEKERTENQMSGGFAHEIRNALAGAKMLLRTILFSDSQNKEPQSLAVKNSEHLLDIFKLLKGIIDPPLFKQVAGKIKAITDAEKKMDQLTHKAYESIERSLSVTTMIMEYSKVGSQERGDELVDLSKLLSNFCEEQRRELEDNHIRLIANLNDGLLVRGNENHFHSVFSNIILNAKDALLDDRRESERERCIQIESAVENGRARVSIKDTGTGIPEDVKAKIFEPFFSTKPETGTGLGLGMVEKYVSIYEGELRVNSEPGKWTEFVVALPLEQQASKTEGEVES